MGDRGFLVLKFMGERYKKKMVEFWIEVKGVSFFGVWRLDLGWELFFSFKVSVVFWLIIVVWDEIFCFKFVILMLVN